LFAWRSGQACWSLAVRADSRIGAQSGIEGLVAQATRGGPGLRGAGGGHAGLLAGWAPNRDRLGARPVHDSSGRTRPAGSTGSGRWCGASRGIGSGARTP